jgi:transaldolase
VDKALRLVELYAHRGVDPSRLYIKIAATWEGIQACGRLQKQGVDCNMTLLFSFAQVRAPPHLGGAQVQGLLTQ